LDSSSSRFAFAALLAGATGIGFAPVLVRLSEIGPSATAFFRILFALPLLWGWLGIEREKSPSARRPVNRNDYLWLVSAGLFFTGDLAVWHWSLQFTSVANSTLLTNFAPIFVTLGARFLFAEHISRGFVLGMLLALGGAVMLVGASFNLNARHLLGDLLAIGTALFYAGYLLAVKHLRHSFSSATIMAWSGLVSCPALLLIAVCSGENLLPASAGGWWVLIALALISHVGGQTLIAYAFGHLPASFSSVSLLLQPVVAAAVAWLVLHEPLSFPQGLGGLVVLAGITLASQRGV
jgi:drug/metabolite transporter (DMT)-like permease